MDAADADVSGDQEGPGDQKEPEDVRRQDMVSDEGESVNRMKNLQHVDTVPVQKKKKIASMKIRKFLSAPRLSSSGLGPCRTCVLVGMRSGLGRAGKESVE